MGTYIVDHSVDDICRYFGSQPKIFIKKSKKPELAEAVFFDFYKDPEQLVSEFYWEAYFLAEQRRVVNF